jgi:hypothetical protein
MLSIGVQWEGGERGCCAANDGVVASAEVFQDCFVNWLTVGDAD